MKAMADDGRTKITVFSAGLDRDLPAIGWQQRHPTRLASKGTVSMELQFPRPWLYNACFNELRIPKRCHSSRINLLTLFSSRSFQAPAEEQTSHFQDLESQTEKDVRKKSIYVLPEKRKKDDRRQPSTRRGMGEEEEEEVGRAVRRRISNEARTGL